VNGVTYDGRSVWFAAGDKLVALDPESGKTLRSIEVAVARRNRLRWPAPVPARRGSHPQDRSRTGSVIATIPAPGGGSDSGLTWAEGTLWVGQYRDRKIHQVDPATGAILRTIESNRFVTGVTWVEESSGMPPGKVMRATCGASILERVRFWRDSRCRPERAFRARVRRPRSLSSAVEARAER
jgi:streptogramin lyase